MRLEKILADRARSTPERIAIAVGQTKLTYGDLDGMSDRLASALAGRGMGPGDRIAVFMEDWCETVLAIFGTLKAGAAANPVHPMAPLEILTFSLREGGARAIVTEARLAGVAARALAEVDSVKLVILAGGGDGPAATGCLRFEDALAAVPGTASPRSDDRDGALLVPRLRSAGLVPGLMMTHRDFADTLSAAVLPGAGEGDATITTLPLASEEGLRQLFAAIQRGVTLVRTGASASDRRPIRYMHERPKALRSSRAQ